jgi:hypothetical protein
VPSLNSPMAAFCTVKGYISVHILHGFIYFCTNTVYNNVLCIVTIHCNQYNYTVYSPAPRGEYVMVVCALRIMYYIQFICSYICMYNHVSDS